MRDLRPSISPSSWDTIRLSTSPRKQMEETGKREGGEGCGRRAQQRIAAFSLMQAMK